MKREPKLNSYYVGYSFIAIYDVEYYVRFTLYANWNGEWTGTENRIGTTGNTESGLIQSPGA